jgi:hypothetical protein
MITGVDSVQQGSFQRLYEKDDVRGEKKKKINPPKERD